jgi:hypothetical protein
MSKLREITEEMQKKFDVEHRKTTDHRPRLTELQGGNRIRQFIKGMKTAGLRIDEYWTGGGGNDNVQCLAMC